MSKNSVADWDTTADNNTDVGGIAITNSQTIDRVDDIIRELMAQVASAGFVTLTTTAAFLTSLFSLADSSDGTKKLAFNLSSITTGTTRTVTVPDASGTLALAGTAAEFRANSAVKGLMIDQAWSAAGEVSLTDAATIAVDMSTFINATVTLGGNRTLGQPSNTKVGQTGRIKIVQDGTGSRTLSYHADWKFAGGTAPTLTTTASRTDVLYYEVLGANKILASLVKDVR